MKKYLTVCMALLMLVPPLARGMAEEYVNVREVYAETRAPWQATYFFPNGESYAGLSANYSFTVDLTPSVPEVDRFPVLKVKMKPVVLSEEELSRFYIDDAKGREKQRAMGFVVLKTGNVLNGSPQAELAEHFYDEMEQARDNPLTPDDAAEVAASLWRRYLGVDNIVVRGVIGYDREPRFYGEYLDMEKDPENRRLRSTDVGAYNVVGEQLLAGIPLLDTITIYGEYPDGQDVLYPVIDCEITLLDENRFIFKGGAVEVVEEAYADVPLLPFARIREIYEGTIGNAYDPTAQHALGVPWTSGKPLINVMSAELGYMLALAPGDPGTQLADTTFLTRPVWILRGYVPLQTLGGDAIAQEQTLLNHPLGLRYGLSRLNNYMCIDAQTGEVLNWPNLGSSYVHLETRILTWPQQ